LSEKLIKKLQELKQIYPEVVSIVDGWQQLARVHGVTQTEEEKKVLEKYVKILKELDVIEI